MEKDRHVTVWTIQATLGIAIKEINSIMHDHLNARRLCFRFILHNLSIIQRRIVSTGAKLFILKCFVRSSSHLVLKIVICNASWI